jgi:membrane protease YdiL (CAAX protease family)
LAWLVILAVAGVILWRPAERRARDAAASLVLLRAEARYLVGVKALGLPGAPTEELYRQAQERLQRGDYAERLRFAVVAGEVVGPGEARRVLRELDEDRRAGEVEPTERQAQAARLLDRLYAGYERDFNKLVASAGYLFTLLPSSSWARLSLAGLAQPISEPLGPPPRPVEEQDRLRQDLGWFGELALAPEGGDSERRERALAPARRTVMGLFTVAAGAIFGFAAGVFLLVLAAALAFLGRLPGGLAPSGHGGVYAETFAAYFALYLGLQFGLGPLSGRLPEGWRGLWLSGLAMLLSLLALGWPVLRGVPWRQVRRDLGLFAGERPAVEVLVGVGCYLTAIPVLVVGLLILAGLMALRRRLGLPGGDPSHPVVGVALSRDWWVWVQLFVVAAVLAPLVEETMFRGALYRHLREATGWWRPGVSVAASAVGSGVLFAAIHPQGWLAVPALAGLAVVLALAREWRGTLLPSMVAHGINNGVVTLVLLAAAG